jgi:hypothetical protein
MEPPLSPATRLKVGTFKVVSNGYKLGERFLRIAFENAVRRRVDEIYVTIFRKRDDHERLILLLEDWGFRPHGVKTSAAGVENVFVRNMRPHVHASDPRESYPFFSRSARKFIVPILRCSPI